MRRDWHCRTRTGSFRETARMSANTMNSYRRASFYCLTLAYRIRWYTITNLPDGALSARASARNHAVA
eukprot:scaffold323767_cov38-Prasinocladus_malaysianus.AAC.2